MSDTTGVVDDDEERGIWGRLELIAAIILGVAGVLTAFCAYKGALADGDSLDKYSESNQLISDANGYYVDATQQEGQDLTVFTQWALLFLNDDLENAEVLQTSLFSDELKAAFDVWVALPEDQQPETPLDLEEEYQLQLPDRIDADATYEAALVAQEEAREANDKGDQFELASVFFALSLFLAGIATLFKVRTVKIGVLAGAVVLIIPGAIAMSQGF
jgi:hypothetical protein